jgi:hypothetical protein
MGTKERIINGDQLDINIAGINRVHEVLQLTKNWWDKQGRVPPAHEPYPSGRSRREFEEENTQRQDYHGVHERIPPPLRKALGKDGRQ